jgi:hypothetical protein
VKKLLEKLDLARGSVNKEEIAKIATLKKNRAKKSFAPIVQDLQVQPLPELSQTS